VRFVRVVETFGDLAVVVGILPITQLQGVGNEFSLLLTQKRNLALDLIKAHDENLIWKRFFRKACLIA